MSTFVMSGLYPALCSAMEDKGHHVIMSDKIKAFHVAEQTHADMQVLPIDNDIFMLNECVETAEKLKGKRLHFCKRKAGKMYPENVLLNFLYLNHKLYGKQSAIDENLRDYCINREIKRINVNQGYARCSTLVVNENAVITSDVSIAKALEGNGVEVLLISPGHIRLDGFDYGFIGGTGGKIDNKTIAFFGDITKHPDYAEIKEFCGNNHSNIELLCKEMPLTDIGGMVKIP